MKPRKATHPVEFRAWQMMQQRCQNPRYPQYKYWGGRGITVHPSWRNGFEKFFSCVGPRPSPDHSIDRIDNDGNYEPGNVRWATAKEQYHNQRHNPLTHEKHPRAKLTFEQVLEIRASKLSQPVLAAKYGVASSTIYYARSGHTWRVK